MIIIVILLFFLCMNLTLTVRANSNPFWLQAMIDELQALAKTHTWDLMDFPSSKTANGCKWVYKIKTHFDNTIECYKAHLVARGFTQEYSIDYEKKFVILTLPPFVVSLSLMLSASGAYIKLI